MEMLKGERRRDGGWKEKREKDGEEKGEVIDRACEREREREKGKGNGALGCIHENIAYENIHSPFSLLFRCFFLLLLLLLLHHLFHHRRFLG